MSPTIYDYMTVLADPDRLGPRGSVLGWMVVAGASPDGKGGQVIYRDPDKNSCFGFVDGCRWERGRHQVGA